MAGGALCEAWEDIAVVDLALLVVAEDRIGFGHAAEAVGGRGVVAVAGDVGVGFFAEHVEPLFEVGFGRVGGHTECIVV